MKPIQANTTFPLGGYHRRLLRVNLTQGTIGSEDIPSDILRSFIGGTGLGIYLLYTEVSPRTAPFASENKLIIATGPLTGTLVPGSGTYTVLSKSPLTGFAMEHRLVFPFALPMQSRLSLQSHFSPKTPHCRCGHSRFLKTAVANNSAS